MRLRQLVQRFGSAIRRAQRTMSPPVSISDLILREATLADLRPLAELHVRTFNETHVGPFGSGPTFATREWQWREKLSAIDATHFVFALETEARQFVGFIWCHPTNEHPPWAARLNKIYLLSAYQRLGLGTRLVAAAVDRLLDNDLTSMVLFTEADNEPACNFNDKLGGERQLDEHGVFGGMFGWRDLRKLSGELKQQRGLG
jgi:ribosomal protein S18 acetylase RimI-like enzyme